MKSLVLLLLISSAAIANLRVFPTRLMLTQKNRVGQLGLRHMGQEATTYKISTVFYRMKEDGSVELAQNVGPTDHSAIPYLRFSPRQVTLQPNVDQIVKVLYTGPPNLPEGDYRAHVHFEPIAEEPKKDEKAKRDKITMKLQVRLAVAVPVLYRQGSPKTEVKLTDLKIIKNPAHKDFFEAQMISEGSAYPFGNVFVYFVPEDPQAPPVQVGLVRSIASYIPKRILKYELTVPEGLSTQKGKWRAEFRTPEEDGDSLLAQTETKDTSP